MAKVATARLESVNKLSISILQPVTEPGFLDARLFKIFIEENRTTAFPEARKLCKAKEYIRNAQKNILNYQ